MTGTGLRGRVAIVGAAESDLGEVPGYTSWDLAGQAAARALADAQLDLREVDGLFSASANDVSATLAVGEYLGLRPTYSDGTHVGGSSFVSHLLHAASAIEAGLCDTALIVYGSNQRSAGGRLVSLAQPLGYEAPYRPRAPISMYALAADRHMSQFGTTRSDLAEVAVAARAWASLNPQAFARAPLTVGEVLASRVVSSPLSALDCCLVTDGGGAVVLTSGERARDLRDDPVYVLGVGEAQTHRHISQMPDLVTTPAVASGPRAFKMAGLRVEDVDVVQLYDAFTINTLLFLEDLGFCAKGDAGAFVADGAIAPGGRLPVNTSGGGLSYCHPGMFGLLMLVEAVHQLRGESGDRQVPDPDVALVHANGGVLSSGVTALLGTPATIN